MGMFETKLIVEAAQWLWGSWDSQLQTLAILTAVEVFSSIVLAIHKHRCSGRGCLQTVARMVVMFLLVGTAQVIGSRTGESGILRTIIVGYYIAYERNCILENALSIGLPLPWKLKGFTQNKGKDNAN